MSTRNRRMTLLAVVLMTAVVATVPEFAQESRAGELPPDFDCNEVAGFVVSSMQGANLVAKAQRSTVPVERFKKILFSMVLR